MSDSDIRIGVVGAGAIGPSHMYSIGQVPGATLTAICDIREEAAKSVAAEREIHSFTDTGDMVRSGSVDAITIATPSGFHLDSILAALESDIPVLVEKPIEITTERIDRIIAAEQSSGGFVAAVYQSRFRPLVRRMKQLIDSGLVGEIYSGSVYIKRYRTQQYYDSGGWRGTWKVDGGGCLMNQGIHDIDLYQWFMGPPARVTAITETKGRSVEVETLALALVRFSSGASGVIEATTLAYPEFAPYIEIFGSRGTVAFSHSRLIRMEIIDMSSDESAAKDELLAATADHDKRIGESKHAEAGTAVPNVDMGHTPVIEDFVEAIKSARPPLVTSQAAREAVALITSIYESGRSEGSWVTVA